MDRTEAIIIQHFYWSDIIDAVRKEVNNCDTCKRTNRSNKEYGKLPAKLAEEIPWNKLFVNLIGPYVIHRKVQKEKFHIKSVTMINPVIGWFEFVRYDDKRAINIANLVETTWLSRYPRPIEIIYYQGKEFIGHKFRKSLIET